MPDDESPLISVAQLRARLDRPDRPVTLLDVRFAPGGGDGRADYLAAHLPGAAYVDFEHALSGSAGPDGRGGRHPMPTTASFQSAMRAAGVVQDRPVVCYDAGEGFAASRCWWLLRYFGKDDVRVLDGGLAAWDAAGRATERDQPPVHPGDFVARPGGARLLDAEQARRLALDGALLDARSRERFLGLEVTMDPVAGHIPGARPLPALECNATAGGMRPLGELRQELEAQIGAAAEVGTYCGSGVQASYVALVLAATGVSPDAGVYIGSFSDWISDPQRPVELPGPEGAAAP